MYSSSMKALEKGEVELPLESCVGLLAGGQAVASADQGLAQVGLGLLEVRFDHLPRQLPARARRAGAGRDRCRTTPYRKEQGLSRLSDLRLAESAILIDQCSIRDPRKLSIVIAFGFSANVYPRTWPRLRVTAIT